MGVRRSIHWVGEEDKVVQQEDKDYTYWELGDEVMAELREDGDIGELEDKGMARLQGEDRWWEQLFQSIGAPRERGNTSDSEDEAERWPLPPSFQKLRTEIESIINRPGHRWPRSSSRGVRGPRPDLRWIARRWETVVRRGRADWEFTKTILRLLTVN